MSPGPDIKTQRESSRIHNLFLVRPRGIKQSSKDLWSQIEHKSCTEICLCKAHTGKKVDVQDVHMSVQLTTFA